MKSALKSSEIAALLLKHEAVSLRPSRPFIWASGIRSPIYCDNRLLLSHPKARDAVMASFLKLIKDKKLRFDAIAGIATAGIPHASILADRLGVPLLYVRASPKAHGKANRIEGHFSKGSRILVIEDLVSTGGSSLEAVKALRTAGAKVSDCLAIFSYGFVFSKNAFHRDRCKLHTITDLETLLSVAVDEERIDATEKGLVEKFAKNPNGWLGY